MTDTSTSTTRLPAPDTEVSVREVFGIDIDMTVPAFSEADERVPDLDDSYVFDPDTTLAILAGFAFNRRVMVQGYHGTGKSTHSSLLASTYSPSSSSSHPLRQIDVGVLVKQEGFYTEYLEEWQSYEVNEDQLLDHLEPLTGTKAPEPVDGEEFDEDELRQAKEQGEDDDARGGLVLDWHTCDVWPERWADLVVVLRCDHSVLWERLEKR